MRSEPDLAATIAGLVRNLHPVAPLEPPALRLLRWAATTTGLGLVSVILLGVRPDAAERVQAGWFLLRAAATLGMAMAGAGIAFVTSVPGRGRSLVARALPAATGLVWAGLLAQTITGIGSPIALLSGATVHPVCVLLVTTIALPPGVVLARMLRHGAPLQAGWTAACAGLASAGVGALGAQFVCANDAAAHHLVWHVTPVAVLTAAAAVAGPWLLPGPSRPPRPGGLGARWR